MKIVVTASERYIKSISALINSCNVNYPQGEMVARLVNCSDETIEKFKTRFPTIDVRCVYYVDDHARKNLCANGALLQDGIFNIYDIKNRSDFKGARWLYSDFMARVTNDRYQTLVDLLEDGNDCVLSIDADTIIRGDLTPLRNKILQHDVCLHCEIVKEGLPVDFGNMINIDDIPVLTRHQYKRKEYTKCNPNYIEWHTGVIGFNNTSSSIKLLKEFRDTLLKPENVHIWGAEEEEIYFLFLKYHETAKYWNIPIKFKDEGYGTNRQVGTNQYDSASCIWVGAGPNKYNCNLFTDEVNKYA